MMRRSAPPQGLRIRRSLILLFLALSGFAQPNPQAPDPYKPLLDRLASLLVVPLPEWRYHADLPHPEDPSLDDSTWQTMKIDDKWTSGPRVLRRWIEIPEKINGYAVEGSRIKLDLNISSNDAEILTAFS